jgi:hypothetical protein
VADGYDVQFVLLSDVNATDIVPYAAVPIFRDPSTGRVAWKEMASNAAKHDTFVFDPTGTRTLYWKASANALEQWAGDIRAAAIAAAP